MRVLGGSPERVLRPAADERAGYVPNICSCGAILRGLCVFLPYAVVDNFCPFASLAVDALPATAV